jgi:hypothetical protein
MYNIHAHIERERAKKKNIRTEKKKKKDTYIEELI